MSCPSYSLGGLMGKRRTNSTEVLPRQRAKKLRENIMNLENLSVSDITYLL